MCSEVAISMEAMFRVCGIVDNLKLAVFVIKPIMSLHMSVIVSFFVSELPVVPANKVLLLLLLLLLLFTVLELSLGDSSPYTCTDK
jgi:hypothetical protein